MKSDRSPPGSDHRAPEESTISRVDLLAQQLHELFKIQVESFRYLHCCNDQRDFAFRGNCPSFFVLSDFCVFSLTSSGERSPDGVGGGFRGRWDQSLRLSDCEVHQKADVPRGGSMAPLHATFAIAITRSRSVDKTDRCYSATPCRRRLPHGPRSLVKNSFDEATSNPLAFLRIKLRYTSSLPSNNATPNLPINQSPVYISPEIVTPCPLLLSKTRRCSFLHFPAAIFAIPFLRAPKSTFGHFRIYGLAGRSSERSPDRQHL